MINTSVLRIARSGALVVGLLGPLAVISCGIDVGDGVRGAESVAVGSTQQFVRRGSNKCLDVNGSGTADGTKIQQWGCNTSGAQAFQVQDAGGGKVKLVNPHSQKCVDISASGTADGTKVQLYTCNGTGAQAFQIQDVGGGYNRIFQPSSGKCLDVAAASADDGAQVQLYTCNGTDAQAWRTQASSNSDTTVTLFDQTLFSWDSKADHRTNQANVTLPSGGTYRQITLHIELACPSGGCDPYDRFASLGIVDGSRVIEIGRYATPFGVAGSWDVDVTDLRPLLDGARTVQGFIDTWVGNGSGWLVTARLVYLGGTPAKVPVAVLPLGWGNFNIGDPGQSTSASQSVTMPAGATSAAVRAFVTGHGQGNQNNCAEFCDLPHTVSVNGSTVQQRSLWRNDCSSNPINNQHGTWQYAREGWCPGADVKPWTVDLGARSGSFTVGYALGGYVNACRPGSGCNTSACVFGTSCDYDGGLHTQPYMALSAVVVAYR